MKNNLKTICGEAHEPLTKTEKELKVILTSYQGGIEENE